jgi:hypothetical protein
VSTICPSTTRKTEHIRWRQRGLPSPNLSKELGEPDALPPGKYYGLFTKTDDENIPKFPRPSILTENITVLILKIIASGYKNPFDFNFVHRPVGPQVDVAIMNLLLMECVRPDTSHVGPFITDKGRIVASLWVDAEAVHFLHCAWLWGSASDRGEIVTARELFDKENEVWERRCAGRRADPPPLWMRALPGWWCDIDIIIYAIRNVRKNTPLTGTRTRTLTDAVANSESTRQRLAEADLPVPPSPSSWSRIFQMAFFQNFAVYQPSLDCYNSAEGVGADLSPYLSNFSSVIFATAVDAVTKQKLRVVAYYRYSRMLP